MQPGLFLTSLLGGIFLLISQADAGDLQKLTLAEVLKRAGNGEATAQHEACYRYSYGEKARISYRLAHKWCAKGAAQGISHSQTLLAQLHFFGRGVPRDVKRAAELYQQAADQGHSHAQMMLALIRGDDRNAENAASGGRAKAKSLLRQKRLAEMEGSI
mgnify:CR=1 FL=1